LALGADSVYDGAMADPPAPPPVPRPPDDAGARLLVAALSRRGADVPEGFAAAAAEALADVAARWEGAPSMSEAAEDFAAALAPRLSPRVALADVFLAWWCSTGAEAALLAFEREHGTELTQLAARFRDLPTDELRQQLRIKLFLGEPPRILDYRGTGPLRNWLRVTAVRAYVDVQRANKHRATERELAESDLLGDPRGEHVRAEVAAAVKRGFANAVAGLSARERVFLRHVYVDQHTLEQIAATYCIHRATVARVLASARAQLVAGTRAAVAEQLGGDSEELSTAIRALESNVELSLSRVLAP
jgi:RNA polymerase sigma-70 factor (ECF subfamily)